MYSTGDVVFILISVIMLEGCPVRFYTDNTLFYFLVVRNERL